MLAIRMQRTGRSGHAQYRVVVQDSRFSPTSGRVVAYLGAYNPHTKETTLDSEKAAAFLKNGAQPSDRVVRLLKAQGVKLPDWVADPAQKQRTVRNAEKLRKNRPAEEPAAAEAPAEEAAEATEPAKETAPEVPAEETPETAAEAPETASEAEEAPEATPEPAAEPEAEDK